MYGMTTNQYYSYRVEPSNYYTLSEDERVAKLRRFIGIISRIKKQLDITMTSKPVSLNGLEYTEKTIHIGSYQDMGEIISESGFGAIRLERPHMLKIDAEHADHIIINEMLYRAYVLYSMSYSITPAWINGLYDICGNVIIRMWPIKPSRARRMLISHANIADARIGKMHAEDAVRARHVRDLLEKEESSLVECAIIPLVSGATPKSLRANCKTFEQNATWRQMRCASIYGMQDSIVRGSGHRFLFELGSCAVFYPFESSNMIESSGVYLGRNMINDTPVIYEYNRRVNYNVTMIGESGRGKSTAAKTYVDNFLRITQEKYGAGHRIMLCVIDPHGEYAPLYKQFDAQVMDLEGRQRMGLDPFRICDESSSAASILADASEMPANLRSVTISVSDDCSSVPELIERLTSNSGPQSQDCAKASSYLLQFAHGDVSRIFEGQPDTHDRTIYTMRKADKSKLNGMIVSMAMARAWRSMRDAPRHVPKLFVIDEGWFVSSMESTGQILEDIARSGRKENVHLLFLSQEPSDILDNLHGRAVLNNSATILLFGLKPDLAQTLQEVLRLSDTERSEIENLDRGCAMLRADDHRIKLRIQPTTAQLEMFNIVTMIRVLTNS